VTKEIHKLVAASRAFERDPDRNPFARDGRTGTESVYWQALSRRWNDQGDTDRVHLRVVVDIVAGTSAGGINGIFLAKALADGGSQDRLRDLWMTQGDIARLVRGPVGSPGSSGSARGSAGSAGVEPFSAGRPHRCGATT
jgi:hypothetical protein